MMTQETNTRSTQLQELCAAVRKYSTARDYQKCAAMICKAMGEFPNAPQPHNLFGIVLEKEGDHVGAMKHFRAAYALDPTYRRGKIWRFTVHFILAANARLMRAIARRQPRRLM